MFRPNTMIAKEAKRHHEIGLQEGWQEGRQEGLREGFQQGIEQGAAEQQKQIVEAMREKGFSDKEIGEITGIIVEQV